MKTAKRFSRHRLALSLMIVFLSAGGFWQYSRFDREGLLAPSASRNSTAPDVPPPALPPLAPLAKFRIITEAPLFNPGRIPLLERKPASSVQPQRQAANALPPPEGYLMRGAILTESLRTVILENTRNPEYLRLKEGEQLKGWTIARVEKTKVVLRYQDRTLVWDLAKPGEQR